MRTWVLLLFCLLAIVAVAIAEREQDRPVSKGDKNNRERDSDDKGRDRPNKNKSPKNDNIDRKPNDDDNDKDGKGQRGKKAKKEQENDKVRGKEPRNGDKKNRNPNSDDDDDKPRRRPAKKNLGRKEERKEKKEGKKVLNRPQEEEKPKRVKILAERKKCAGKCVKSAEDCKGRVTSDKCPGKEVCCRKITAKVKKGGTKRFCRPLEPCNQVLGECRKKKTGCKKGEKRYKNTREVSYCSKRSCICCASPCTTKRKCQNLGGVCGLKKDGCDGTFVKDKKYCNGKQCGCCVPGDFNPCKTKKTCSNEGGECMLKTATCDGVLMKKNSAGKKYCKGKGCACCLPGCLDKNGTIHAEGSSWTDPNDPCYFYYCYGGQIQIAVADCLPPPTNCPGGPIYTPGECCPTYNCTTTTPLSGCLDENDTMHSFECKY